MRPFDAPRRIEFRLRIQPGANVETFTISRGLIIREGETPYEFDKEIAGEKVPTYVFHNQLTGKPRVLTLGDLHKGLQSHQFKLIAQADGPISESDRAKSAFKVSDLPTKIKDDFLRKRSWVRGAFKAGIQLGSRAQLAKFLAAQGGKNPETREPDTKVPSVTTLYRWAAQWIKAGMTDAVLITGNFARKRKAQIGGAVRGIINRVVRQVYMTNAQNTKRQVHEEIETQLQKEVKEGRLEPRQAKVSFSTVRRYIGKFDPFEVMAARRGYHYAKNYFRYGKTASTFSPMARYEVDHTILDIVALCPHTFTPLGRPTLTLIADTGSGYPVGAFISFWGTGLATTLSALKVAISPKHDITSALEMEEEWYGYGIPQMFVVDNGLEFHSSQFMLAAAAMSTEVQFAPVRMGWYKPIIERRLQDVTRRLPAEGKVHKRPSNNYLPPNPDATAAIIFDDLCENIVRGLVSDVPFQPSEFRLSRSVDLFRDAFSNMLPPRMPGNMDDLTLIAAMQVERTVSHNGVMVEWLPYRSPELAQVRRVVGQNFKAVVKFDPQNLQAVYVQNPLNREWVAVPCAFEEYAFHLSVVQHRAIRKFLKNKLTRMNAYQSFMDQKRVLREMWAASAKRGKRRSADVLRAMGGLTSANVLSTTESEAPAPKIWTPPQEMLIPDRSSIKDAMEESIETFDFL